MKKDRKVLKRKPYSNHPGDHYLEIVLCEVEWGCDPYVTWMYNKQDGGCYYGHYFKTLDEATSDFFERERKVS